MELLDKILNQENLNKAYKKVVSNKGVARGDGVTLDEVAEYIKEHKEEIISKIKERKYKPQPVKRVQIPKENGKMRNLGIPTVFLGTYLNHTILHKNIANIKVYKELNISIKYYLLEILQLYYYILWRKIMGKFENGLDSNNTWYEQNLNKAKRIYENEKKIFDEIIEQCTNETQIGENLYRLPTGQYVVINRNNGITTISNNKYILMNNGDINISENGTYISYSNTGDLGLSNITYGAIKDKHFIFVGRIKEISEANIESVRKGIDATILPSFSIGKEDKIITVNDEGESLIDIIDKLPQEIRGQEEETIINEFKKLLQPHEREDLQEEPDLDRKLRNFNKKIAMLEQQNAELEQENSQLKQQNTQLSQEYMELKERFTKLRKFITERCAKIPILGKRLLGEMQHELKENELSEDNYHSSQDER